MWQIKKLQQRLALFVLLPVAGFLAGAGVLGYVYIRDILLQEWQEIALLRLERAAHQMDMRVQLNWQWVEALTRADNQEAQDWALEQLRQQEGVSQVTVTWQDPEAPGFRPVEKISPPGYFYPEDKKTVGLKTELQDRNGHTLGKLTVLVRFDYLMQDVLAVGWLQTHMACLVDVQAGQFLAHTDPTMQSRHCLGETQDPLELAMFKAMKDKHSDTLVGSGYFPREVVGFYRLHTAPWAIMLHARGGQILAPILNFRFYYLGAGILCLAIILALIRLGVGPVVKAIGKISIKAAQVARGDYGEPLPVTSHDEIGRLTVSFNEMVAGLRERDFISNTFGRYVDQEIARELLSRPEAARLGGEKRQVAILFADLRDFTPLAETLSPEATIHLVNQFFSQMIEVIQNHRGIIVDFLGDAILAFFDPLEGPLAPTVRQAVVCGLEMQRAMGRVNLPDSGFPPLHMGIGVHAGEVVVGNVGSESRAKYGIVGAAVNLTHRLQAQAHGGEVVISEAVHRQMPKGLEIQRTFHAHLKGIQEVMTLYVVQGVE